MADGHSPGLHKNALDETKKKESAANSQQHMSAQNLRAGLQIENQRSMESDLVLGAAALLV